MLIIAAVGWPAVSEYTGQIRLIMGLGITSAEAVRRLNETAVAEIAENADRIFLREFFIIINSFSRRYTNYNISSYKKSGFLYEQRLDLLGN